MSICRRIVRVHSIVFPPGASPTRLYPFHVPAEHAGGPAVVGVVLDRPRVGAGAHLARNPHDADDNDAELGTGSISGGIFHEGDRRMDGHLSRLCVRCIHRIFHRQRAGTTREDQRRRHQQSIGDRRNIAGDQYKYSRWFFFDQIASIFICQI